MPAGVETLQRRFEHVQARCPEYWILGLSAAAWISMAARAGAHVHHQGTAASWWHWMVMVAAMMLPLKIDGVRWTAERSLWSRRNRSIAGYLAGYAGVWALVGIPLAWAGTALELTHRLDWMVGAAIGLLIAAAWLLTPWKAVAVRLCHRTLPLAPLGWKADRDCVRYGWMSGCGCAFNCWPLMLACWLSGHSLAVMTIGLGFGWADRHFAPNYRGHALMLAALAAVFTVCSQIG
jgi:hypothetical protein